jgi:hypothetical protein
MKTQNHPVAVVTRGAEFAFTLFLKDVWPYIEPPTPSELDQAILVRAQIIAQRLQRRVWFVGGVFPVMLMIDP